jgi:hypothetical protein
MHPLLILVAMAVSSRRALAIDTVSITITRQHACVGNYIKRVFNPSDDQASREISHTRALSAVIAILHTLRF